MLPRRDAAKAYNEEAQDLFEYFKSNVLSDDEADDVVAYDETNATDEEVAKDVSFKQADSRLLRQAS